jgi:hypothetical protein
MMKQSMTLWAGEEKKTPPKVENGAAERARFF